jgi:uncharacterized phage-associated protein
MVKAEPKLTSSTAIKFRFNEARATEAASLLLQLSSGRMTRLRLIKLLYFADRESLLRFGHPICGGKYVSMPHGPVLSNLYSIITNTLWTESEGPWEEHFENIGSREIVLIKEAKPQKLSRAQIDVLNTVFERHRHLTDWQIRNLGHELPEYEDPGKSSKEIPVKRILLAQKKSEEEIKEIAEDAQASECLESFFCR